jgi:hypothetical protein
MSQSSNTIPDVVGKAHEGIRLCVAHAGDIAQLVRGARRALVLERRLLGVADREHVGVRLLLVAQLLHDLRHFGRLELVRGAYAARRRGGVVEGGWRLPDGPWAWAWAA